MPDDMQARLLQERRKAYGREVTLQAAENQLRGHGGYDWLLDSSDKQIWSVGEIVAELEKVGMKVSHDAVTRWIKPLPKTQSFGGAVGLRATRTDLIIFFAEALHNENPREPGKTTKRGRHSILSSQDEKEIKTSSSDDLETVGLRDFEEIEETKKS